ncbi:transcriptional attenuator, LytR family [Crinalium epipsammum PCC 9333]|uniref:Transcriptional attenuator, LytR family n=1 Tax=Crinalium epipsammum PCC 9333 TaxID=1173022 RepID=K9VVX3_9CYAN|nr:LCP family protein [Crinalium epipsammum]AFZ11714.1 transcriptional attenuator, LytR family [Crinalium epipsammum PCC 9333]
MSRSPKVRDIKANKRPLPKNSSKHIANINSNPPNRPLMLQRSPQPRREPVNNSPSHPRVIHRKPQVIRQRRSTNKLLVGAAILISAISGAFLAAAYPTKPYQQGELSPRAAAVFNDESFINSTLLLPSLTRPVNILVLGMSVLPADVNQPNSQTREKGYLAQQHSVDGLSDTMLLVRFNPETKGITIVSIPRDTRVTIGNITQKINAANKIGGRALAAEEVTELLDNQVKIDRFARINVLAVGKIVDALGGLIINVPKDMKYTDESQHLYINLKKGEQRLNGDQVMQFLRFRSDANADIGRVERQQTVIRALIKQSVNPLKLAAIPYALSAVKPDIDTNLTVEELAGLVTFAAQVDRSNVKGIVLPGAPNGTGRRAVSYWLPNRSQISEMVKQYFN